MNLNDLSTALSTAVIGSTAALINFIPSLIGGLIILIIGLVLSEVAYRIVVGVLKAARIEKYLAKYGVTTVDGTEIAWSEILAEVVRWSVILVFLIPTLQTWRLDAVNNVLNRVILYIPNVIVAVVLALVGLVFSKLGYRIVYSAARTLGKDTAHTVALVAQWSITIFVGFLILHQLGVAQELLRILFAGLVAMIALAGGLAFGLGGQGVARSLLETAREKFNR